MSFLNNILNYFKPNPASTPTEFDSNKTTATKEITYSDLHYHEGPSIAIDKLDIEKLEWYISQGKDNECVRAAKREKGEIDKIESARSTRLTPPKNQCAGITMPHTMAFFS
jgi:hypothetical protein